MNFARLATRVAAGGTVAALATAGLVAATGTSASAAPVTTNYTCTTPSGSFPAPVTVDIALLPPTGPAGAPIAAGLLSFKSTIKIPGAVQSALDPAGVQSGKADDFAAAFGTMSVKAPVKWTKPAAADADGNWVYTGTGANAAFLLPAPGTYALAMPTSFTLAATNASGATVITAACSSTAPAQIGSITLSKQNSATKAKAPKSLKKGAALGIKVTVTDDHSKEGGVIPSGKLIVKDGKKKVGKGKLDAKGTAKLSIKGLAVGSHQLVVVYKGDTYNLGSESKTLKVTVKA